MKIYSLSLSLELSVFQPEQSYDFDPISWQSLSEQMAQGLATDRQFYIRDTQGITPRDLFELQADKRWQKSGAAINLLFPDSESLADFHGQFINLFRPRLAAGGLVISDREEYCCIFHHGYWTLPKGHVDPGETISEAAVREVEEETGLTDITLGTPLPTTYHTFEHKGTWRLKTTYWFRMHTHHQPLIPQLEEDITEAAWMSRKGWLEIADQSYPLTRELFEAEFAKDL